MSGYCVIQVVACLDTVWYRWWIVWILCQRAGELTAARRKPGTQVVDCVDTANAPKILII